jgi:hypothetical protein
MVKGMTVVEYSEGKIAGEIKNLWQKITGKLRG